MSTRRTLAAVAFMVAVAACQDPPLTPEHSEEYGPQFAPGGVPGPPPHVVIPQPPGRPPGLPGRRPPHAGPPSFLEDIIDIGAGGTFACALRSDGIVYCWGANQMGQLGDGSLAPSAVPVEVSGPTRFERLFVGNANACGLTAAGEAWCWGSNNAGQIGAGVTGGVNPVPTAVSGGHSFTDLGIGLDAICGVASDGFTYCWGANTRGLLGTGSQGGTSNVPVQVQNSGALGFVAVSVGFVHACGLSGAGQAWCWGLSSLFGNGATGPVMPTPTLSAGGAAITAIEVGIFYTCALDAGGSSSCWGTDNSSGQLGLGSVIQPVLSPTAVVGGLTFASLYSHNHNSIIASTCALTPANEAWCWGSNQFGQLGGPSAEMCTFATTSFDCSSSPVRVSGNIAFAKLAVGINHSCGLDTNGVAWCWGSNAFGQLGDGSMVDTQSPVRVSGLTAAQVMGSIVVMPQTATIILLGDQRTFTAEALDENGIPMAIQPTFSWSSSDPAVAPVDLNGVATALTTGTTIITATAPNGMSGRTVLGVNILDPVLAFQQSWAGGSVDGVVLLGGLLSDEFSHTGTFPTRREVDMRSVSSTNGSVQQTYDRLALARLALEFEAARLQSATPADPRIGQMLTLAGYTWLGFAEMFCSGVPVLDPDVGLTTQQLFDMARTRFAQALAGPISAPYDQVARLGTARAQLGQGDFAGAGLTAAAIPLPFMFATTHSNVQGEQNGVWLVTVPTQRFSVSDLEGTNGLPFRSVIDPRVPWMANGIGQNGISPFFLQLKYTSETSPLVISSGLEAQLIQAEAELAAGLPGAFIARLDNLRAVGGLPPVVDPGTATGRQDLLFSERAFWLYATGTRLGDLRRLVSHYGRAPSSVFPTGAYPLVGGVYGTDANLPVPMSARGPAFAGCTVRDS